jgi:hypothetical protein
VAPWIVVALLGLGVAPPPDAAETEVQAVWLSYPWWRLPRAQKETLASYLAEKGVNRVYLSVYDEGPYITPVDAAACRPGAGPSKGLAQTVAIFKAELASLSGQPERLEEAVAELKAAGFPDAALWVSAVAPGEDGSPNPAIADDIGLLGRTGWR